MQVKGNKSQSLSLPGTFSFLSQSPLHVTQVLFLCDPIEYLACRRSLANSAHTSSPPPPGNVAGSEGQGNGNTRNSGKSILTLDFPHANIKADVELWDVQRFPLPPFVLSCPDRNRICKQDIVRGLCIAHRLHLGAILEPSCLIFLAPGLALLHATHGIFGGKNTDSDAWEEMLMNALFLRRGGTNCLTVTPWRILWNNRIHCDVTNLNSISFL